MKKALSFLRSMRFGLWLLAPVLLCALLGSIVPQGEAEDLYMANFPRTYHLILGLGIDHMFSTPVFLLLTALFGLNLTLCSWSQYRAVPGTRRGTIRRAMGAESVPLTEKQRAALEKHLSRGLWRKETGEEGTAYVTGALTWYGSVIAHFALLGILLGAVGIFGMTTASDCPVLPGRNQLSDGTVIQLESFRVRDETGRIDYASVVEITDPSGRSSGRREISVNHPLRFGANKYFQQSYGAAGVVRVRVKDTGREDTVYMRSQGMISVGGVDGIWYDDVYAGYVTDDEGNIRFLDSVTGDYPDPVYYFIRVDGGVMSPMMALPGEEAETSDAVYTFEEPVLYPAIRVKTTPVWVYVLLYASFAALTVGLYLCFFASPAALVLRENGYSLAGKRSADQREEQLRMILGREE